MENHTNPIDALAEAESLIHKTFAVSVQNPSYVEIADTPLNVKMADVHFSVQPALYDSFLAISSDLYLLEDTTRRFSVVYDWYCSNPDEVTVFGVKHTGRCVTIWPVLVAQNASAYEHEQMTRKAYSTVGIELDT